MKHKKIKNLLSKYTEIIKVLREHGIIKTSNVVMGYGEYTACKKLKLKQNENPTNKGYDAIDSEGKKYEIKSRKENPWNKPTKISVNVDKFNADFLIYIKFNNNWELVKLLKIPKKDVKLKWKGKKDLYIESKELKKYSQIN